MRTTLQILTGVLAVLGISALVSATGDPRRAIDDPKGGMVVHEWGTFLAMHGSDGVALDGMYHEEHALPGFVHARSNDQLKLRSVNIKGETPVIYFYTAKPERVSVRVGFPGGLWTQWYPQASLLGPTLAQLGSATQPRNGHISWTVDVVPPARAEATLPSTSAGALWNYARDVDAAYVKGTDQTRPGAPAEWERFIFYRGLGDAKMPLDVSVHGERITATTTLPTGVRHLYVLRVEGGRGSYQYLPALEAGARIDVAAMTPALPIDRFVETLGDDLAGRLVESGLYEKEARAMVNTWRTSYFRSDGLRMLFVLPQSWTDEYIPMRIDPQPAAIVRVMVGRVELLTAEREHRAEAAVRDLASPDPDVREAAFVALREEGRYVEPIVRRTLRTSASDRVQVLCRRLLMTDFVTALRTSLTDAATGERQPQNPVYARAQLASLLREIGLNEQAKQQGETALALLERLPQPTLANHDSRHMFRALARAHEGAGHDADALAWYGAFVEFGSQAGQTRCGGCHEAEGPRDMSYFRDWWAGRKFGEYAQKTGAAPRLIAQDEAALSQDPQSLAALMRLAYLYEARGDAAMAGKLWPRIELAKLRPKPPKKAPSAPLR